MKHYKRGTWSVAAIAAMSAVVLAATLVLISHVTQSHHSGDELTRPTAASAARTTLLAVSDACSHFLDDQAPGAVAGAQSQGLPLAAGVSESVHTCTDYSRGRNLHPIDRTPFTWNQQCVSARGGRLAANRDPRVGRDTDVLPEPNGNITPAKYAACVVFAANSADCEQFRAAFDNGVPSLRQAAILNDLGCSNTEARPAAS